MSNVLNPAFRQVVFKGNNKTLYRSENDGEFVIAFEEENNNFAIIRNKTSQILFELLSDCGVSNHFVKSNGLKEQKVTALEMLPFVTTVYTSTTDDMAKRLDCGKGMKLKNYLLELKMKQSGREYPIISKDHVLSFDWISESELEKLSASANRVMDILYSFFKAFGCTISAIDLEFGRSYSNGIAKDIVLADELSVRNIKMLVDDMLLLQGHDLVIEIAKRLGILKYE